MHVLASQSPTSATMRNEAPCVTRKSDARYCAFIGVEPDPPFGSGPTLRIDGSSSDNGCSKKP